MVLEDKMLKEMEKSIASLKRYPNLLPQLEAVEESLRQLHRTNAIMKMQNPQNPYFPLIRVMGKLDLIKDVWPW